MRYVGPTLAPDLQVHVGSHSGHGHGGGNVHIDDDFAVVALIAVAAAVAVVTPIAVLDDGYDADAVLPPWPYAVGGGYLDLAHEPQGIADRIAVVGEAWVAGATDDRTMIGARARFDTTWRVGVEGAWTQIHRSEFDAEPFARFGDLLATWRFAQHPRAQFHVGIGGRTLHLDDGDRSGGALAYGFDIFPIRRVVAHGSVGYAKAGGIDCSHGRIAVGVVVNIFECFVGYEYERFDHDHPHGPMIGVRAWF